MRYIFTLYPRLDYLDDRLGRGISIFIRYQRVKNVTKVYVVNLSSRRIDFSRCEYKVKPTQVGDNVNEHALAPIQVNDEFNKDLSNRIF
jgi:hypothetical protein